MQNIWECRFLCYPHEKGSWRRCTSFPLKCCYFLNSNQYQNFFSSPRLKCAQPFCLKRLWSSVYMVSWKIHDHYTFNSLYRMLYLKRYQSEALGPKLKIHWDSTKSLSHIHYVPWGYKIMLRSNTSKKVRDVLTTLILRHKHFKNLIFYTRKLEGPTTGRKKNATNTSSALPSSQLWRQG